MNDVNHKHEEEMRDWISNQSRWYLEALITHLLPKAIGKCAETFLVAFAQEELGRRPSLAKWRDVVSEFEKLPLNSQIKK